MINSLDEARQLYKEFVKAVKELGYTPISDDGVLYSHNGKDTILCFDGPASLPQFDTPFGRISFGGYSHKELKGTFLNWIKENFIYEIIRPYAIPVDKMEYQFSYWGPDIKLIERK